MTIATSHLGREGVSVVLAPFADGGEGWDVVARIDRTATQGRGSALPEGSGRKPAVVRKAKALV